MFLKISCFYKSDAKRNQSHLRKKQKKNEFRELTDLFLTTLCIEIVFYRDPIMKPKHFSTTSVLFYDGVSIIYQLNATNYLVFFLLLLSYFMNLNLL